jgi:spoIIIJ-associated protein
VKEIQKSAKTVERAIEEALAELKAVREEVEIEIIDEGSKGFLGFGSRDAVVKVSRKFNPEKVAKVLQNAGLHCLGCALAHQETIGDIAVVHGVDIDELLAELNATIE